MSILTQYDNISRHFFLVEYHRIDRYLISNKYRNKQNKKHTFFLLTF
jgi:hypothetical protein